MNTCTAVIKYRLKYAPMTTPQAFDVLGMNIRGSPNREAAECRGEGRLYERPEGRILELLQKGHKQYRQMMKLRHNDHEAAVITNRAWEALKKRFARRKMVLH